AIRLDASGAELSARVAAAGAWTTAGDAGWRWQGRLDAAEAERPVALRLVAPASVQVDAQGFELGASSWRVDGAAVELSTLAWRDGSYALRGSAEKLPVGRWAHRAAPDRAASSIEGAREEVGTLSLGGQWDLRGDSPQTPTGRLRVVLQGGAAGEQRGEANVALEAGRLGGNVDLHIPTLAFANRAIGPAWGVAGRLRFRGELGGTVVAPRVDGELDGRSLALVPRELGWRLANGTLDARFEGARAGAARGHRKAGRALRRRPPRAARAATGVGRGGEHDGGHAPARRAAGCLRSARRPAAGAARPWRTHRRLRCDDGHQSPGRSA